MPAEGFEKWGNFIKALISHLLDRYGEEEVKTWYFELWNERDGSYWCASIAEYCKLYDYTERAIHQACGETSRFGPSCHRWRIRSRIPSGFPKALQIGSQFLHRRNGDSLDFITYHVKGGGFPFEMHAQKAVPSVSG